MTARRYRRRGAREKAAKDRAQALLLAAVLGEEAPGTLESACAAAPEALRSAVSRLAGVVGRELVGHAEAHDEVMGCLKAG